MSRFHFVISSSVFAVQDVISEKAVKKKSRQNTNRLQDKGKRKCAGCFFIPLDASQLVIYSSFYPFLSSCFIQTSVHIRGQA